MKQANKEGAKPKYSLPEAEKIYWKDFHFLEEPLIEKQKKKEEQKKQQKKEPAKIAVKPDEQKLAPLPMFSNKKDDVSGDRDLSKLRMQSSQQEEKKAQPESPKREVINLFPNLNPAKQEEEKVGIVADE